MEVQSPGGVMAFGLSNQARIEPMSSVRQSPARTNACTVPEIVEMEVESPPGSNSPCLQNQYPFSAVASPIANPGGMGASHPKPCLGYYNAYSANGWPIRKDRDQDTTFCCLLEFFEGNSKPSNVCTGGVRV